MNRIVALLISLVSLVFSSGCASTNDEMLLRRVRESQGHIARLERALERATIIREALRDEAPASEPLRQVPVREDTRRGTPIGGMQRPFIAQGPGGFALPGVPPGLVATASAIHIGTAPWRAQGEYGGEVAIELGVRRYSVGILVDRQPVEMVIGTRPSTLTIVRDGRVVEEAPGITIRGAGPSTHVWAYFTSPNEAALVTFRCFQSRPGTGTFTEVARWDVTMRTGTTENFNVFDGACDLNRRH